MAVVGFRNKKKMVDKLINRDGTRCHYCGCELNFTDPAHDNYRTFDHKYPVSKGGKSNPGNLVLACFKCNSKKANNIRKFTDVS